jgi:hypothetical protein
MQVIYKEHYISIGIIFLHVEIDRKLIVFSKPYSEENNYSWLATDIVVSSSLQDDLDKLYNERHKIYLDARKAMPIKKGDMVIDKSGVVAYYFRCPEIIDNYIEVMGYGKLHIDNLSR